MDLSLQGKRRLEHLRGPFHKHGLALQLKQELRFEGGWDSNLGRRRPRKPPYSTQAAQRTLPHPPEEGEVVPARLLELVLEMLELVLVARSSLQAHDPYYLRVRVDALETLGNDVWLAGAPTLIEGRELAHIAGPLERSRLR